jgi:AcrR family transcriptional regulator
VDAVHELLEEGRFPDMSVEEIADHAGVSRATLYQHFRSRLELVDALCDTLGTDPALVTIREAIGLPGVDEALDRTIELSVRFWSSERAMLEQLYGAAVVDPAAGTLVRRQRDDRRGEMARLAGRLEAAGRVRAGVDAARAHAILLVLTSFEMFLELHRESPAEADVAALLTAAAHDLLLA